MKEFLIKNKGVIFWTIIIFVVTGFIQYFVFHRTLLGPSGKIGFWEGDINSSQNSQGIADPYSFSHIIHGLIFYFLLTLFSKKLSVKNRFIIALILEASWELFENSSFIINRYREGTIAQGYYGDSVLNSMSDIFMMALGFVSAKLGKVWFSILILILMELGCLYFIRDNLTLNIIMLVHPTESIREWQSGIHKKVDRG